MSVSTTSTYAPAESSNLTTPFSPISIQSPLAVNQIPPAAIAGGTVVAVLSLLLLTLVAWLHFRRVQSNRRKAELPIQSPSLSSLVGLGNIYLTPVPSTSSMTWIATDAARLPCIEQQESMTFPVSPAAQSSMVMPLEGLHGLQVSAASTIVLVSS